jgi:hypothetical protein
MIAKIVIRRFTVAAIVSLAVLPLSAQADDDLSRPERALTLISNFADKLCKDVPLKGGSDSVELTGSAKAELKGIVKKMADLGFEGAAKYKDSGYEGLLQADLAATIKDKTQCRLQVWNDLKDKLVGTQAAPPPPPMDSLRVAITAPTNDSVVDVHDNISGTVSDKKASVWIVIQPLETMGCWIQKRILVDTNGTWIASVQFGESTPEHSGKRYEVRAFANPHSNLSPGPTACWPKADAQSAALYVRRR